jgi:hypothetical protein
MVVTSNLSPGGQEFNVTAIEAPKGFSITKLADQTRKLQQEAGAQNLAVYGITWTPDPIDDQATDGEIKLQYSSAYSREHCGSAPVEKLYWVVKGSNDEPTLGFENLPQAPINNGDRVEFKIVIADPDGDKGHRPNLEIFFDPASSNSELKRVNGVAAIKNSCSSGTYNEEEKKWSIDCTFDSSKLGLTADSTGADDEDTLEAVFTARATSQNGKKSERQESVEIQFPSATVDTAPAADAGQADFNLSAGK